MNFTIFGLRNLLRNYRRSLITVLSIAIGFAAISLFAGYAQTTYRGLSEQAVYGELLGHLTITKHGLINEGRLHPEQYLMTYNEIEQIAKVVRKNVSDAYVAPRLGINGLLSNGHVSTIFLAEGIAPSDMEVLRGPRRNASGGLSADTQSGVTVARGLAEMLGLKEGSDASLLVSTLHGQANAIDVTITDTFSTGNAGMEDKFMFVPLALVQSLFDAQGRADRITVLLPDVTQTEAVRMQLVTQLKAAGFDLEINTWEELSVFYRQVKSMFDMIFGFLLAIVVSIIVMSITNAMTMSVIERTREIGTLRAIGVHRSSVVRLFATEALLMVMLGCLAGLTLTLLVRFGINAADITYQPPNSTDKVPLLIGFDFTKAIASAVLLSLLSITAAILPAQRAASRPIIDALGHV
ncbi:MAG: ABC transporter permease [Proteobacteria bacterium]|nr:ABC transporter permease [Desulfocapsa sp.]MBU4030533.1 ABC transporter permease [Pseudomonadota bacterium]MBU4044703.1 ABC transporter permease [Pseudomonadota bacterium]